MLIRTLLLIGILGGILVGSPTWARESGVQGTPDGKHILVNKDVNGQRFAITQDRDDRSATGNVFSADGSTFLFCSARGGNVFSCSAAAPCPSAGRESGIQRRPDGKGVLVNKDVSGARYAITQNGDDGTLTGNVFFTDGSDPKFVFCRPRGGSAYDCSVADRCQDSSCADFTPISGVIDLGPMFFAVPAGCPAFKVIGDVPLPDDFFTLPASDSIISGVRGPVFGGVITKIPVTPPPNAPGTLTFEAASDQAQPGGTIGFTVNYAAALTAAEAAGASSLNLFVTSRGGGDPSEGSFALHLDAAQTEAPILVDIRSTIESGVNQFRLDFATGTDDSVTGQVLTVLVLIIRDESPCGNGNIDAGEDCEPPGTRSTCSEGAFCNSACVCQVATVAKCGNNTRELPEECDGSDASSCQLPLRCKSDGSCECEVPICGNGRLEGFEQCDGAEASACGGGTCRDRNQVNACRCNPAPTPTRTPMPRFVDNGDGTVTDHQTGLQWEKKTTDGSVHHVATRWSWCLDDNQDNACDNPSNPPDGSAFTSFLVALNTPPCFAGHCNWRLPSEDGQNAPFTGAKELESILLAPIPCGTSPCIDSIFGPTVADFYWSATSFTTSSSNEAWAVYFDNGGVSGVGKFGDGSHVAAARAVRSLP